MDDEFYFKELELNDLNGMKSLQLELFPVRYSNEFYEDLLNQKGRYTLLCIEKENGKVILI
jgi:hypothetical protein